jgi:hypothetical protein
VTIRRLGVDDGEIREVRVVTIVVNISGCPIEVQNAGVGGVAENSTGSRR